jgi:homoserine O-acetyltransferase
MMMLTRAISPKNTKKIGALVLESGEELPEVEVAYEMAGNLTVEKDNVIVVCHALTGDTHSVGDERSPGWWDGLIGPGAYIDTRRYAVITMNALGGCSGSTGPSSPHPVTGTPYGSRFPQVTIRDMVKAQYTCLKQMGIDHVKAVIGGSMGGMQVLEWAVMYPGFMDACIPIATGATLSSLSMAYNEIGRRAIMQDPMWQGGDYYPDPGPLQGLSIARMVGMVTYRTEALFERRFRKPEEENLQENPQAMVESYLRYQGEKLVKRFDANSYLLFLSAMDGHDLGRGRGGIEKAVDRIRARILTIGITEDLYFPVRQQRSFHQLCLNKGKKAFYHEFSSYYGHDAFLVEYEQFGPKIRQFLEV